MSVQNGQFTRTNLGQADGGNYPLFELKSVQDMVASEREGRPIFRDEEQVLIIMPGNPNTRHAARVSDEHRQRWPKEYAAFKEGHEISPDGTPLEEWAMLGRSQVLELKGMGFKTVEHVANMDDQAIQRIKMGGRRLKELAAAFLDDGERMALTSQLSADKEKLEAEVLALRRQVEEMASLTQQTFSELQTMKNTPSPLATNIPGMSDPVELAKVNQQQPVANSSLDNIATRRKGGRPALPRDAQGNIVRSA